MSDIIQATDQAVNIPLNDPILLDVEDIRERILHRVGRQDAITDVEEHEINSLVGSLNSLLVRLQNSDDVDSLVNIIQMMATGNHPEYGNVHDAVLGALEGISEGLKAKQKLRELRQGSGRGPVNINVANVLLG